MDMIYLARVQFEDGMAEYMIRHRTGLAISGMCTQEYILGEQLARNAAGVPWADLFRLVDLFWSARKSLVGITASKKGGQGDFLCKGQLHAEFRDPDIGAMLQPELGSQCVTPLPHWGAALPGLFR
ncbi:hypothetical protein [Desulfonatronum parangueonense]